MRPIKEENPMAPSITSTLPPIIPVGIGQNFQVCTIADGDAGTLVTIPILLVNPNQRTDFTLYYFPPGGSTETIHFDATGKAIFGPTTGFPLQDACSNFQINIAVPGSYSFILEIVRYSDGAVLAAYESTVDASTVVPLVRLLSSGGVAGATYVSGISRDDAIAGAMGGPSTAVKASVIANTDTDIAMRTWDRLAPYTNSTDFTNVALPPGLTAPQFVWDSVTSSGETRYFAMATPFTPVTSLSGLLVAANNFADNAHDYQASIYDATTKSLIATVPLMLDGNTTLPAIGLTETPPYNWQTIRADSQLISASLSVGTSYYVVVSYQVLNYLILPGGDNPAGLSCMVEIWSIS